MSNNEPIATPEKVYYFDNEFLLTADFQAEQAYGATMLAYHNRFAHAWGILHGLGVVPLSSSVENVRVLTNGRGKKKKTAVAGATGVQVTAGIALDGAGREIVYPGGSPDLSQSSGQFFLTIHYAETDGDPSTKRIAEVPEFSCRTDISFDRSIYLVLARLQRNDDGTFTVLDTSDRSHAGLRAGHLAVAGGAAYLADGEVALRADQYVYGDTQTKFGVDVRVGDQVQISSETRTVVAVESPSQLQVNTAWTLTAECCKMLVRPALLRVEDSAGSTGLFISTEGQIPTTTSATFALIVNGNVYSNNVTNTSDVRLKRDVRPIEGALDRVLALRGVRYHWDGKAGGFDETEHLGLIGQEVETVFPEAVRTDPRGYKAVDYSGMIGALVEAVKEQQNRIEALSARVAVQQKMIDSITVKGVAEKL